MKLLLFALILWSGDSWRTMSRSEILSKANQMIDGAWRPAHNQRGWTRSRSPYIFYAGRTYHGVLYSQNNPVENWSEFSGRIRTAREYYGYWSNNRWYNYIGNDCSGFASIAWGMPARYTTSSFHTEANYRKRYVIALGRTGQAAHVDLKPGDALNRAGSHIILVGRKTSSGVSSLEQTPNNAKRRNWYYSSLSRYQPIRRKDLSDSPQDTIKTQVSITSYPTRVRPNEAFSVLVKASVQQNDAPADLFFEVKDKETGRIIYSRKIENLSSGTHNKTFSGITLPDRGHDYYVYFMATLTPDGGSWSNKYDYATTYSNPTLVSDTTQGSGNDGGDDGNGNGGSGGDNDGGGAVDIPDPGSDFASAYEIQPGTYRQHLDSSDIYDFYKFYVHEGESITITLVPPSDADFDMGLYDPALHKRENSVGDVGEIDVIGCVIDTTGYWYLEVLRYSGDGDYTLKFEVDSITATWTVLVYLNTDNELDGYGDRIINQMEAAHPSPHVNVLVEYDSRNTSPKIYKIRGDNNPSKVTSPVVHNPGNEDLGDGNTLSNFVEWAHREYPASKYALIIRSNGAGWPWISKDFSSGNAISIPEGKFQAALSKIKSTIGKKLDVLALDASLMGMWEVAYSAKDYAEYLVASEEKETETGWNYSSFINIDPKTDAFHLATSMVNSKGDAKVLAAINLSKIDALSSKIDKFAQSLIYYRDIYSSQLDSIRSMFNENTDNHEYGYDPRYSNHDYIDLYRFSYLVASSSLPDDLRNAAFDVMRALNEAVPRVNADRDYSEDSHGISIYYPRDPQNYNHTPFGGNYDNLQSSRKFHWDEFIKGHSGGSGEDYTLSLTTFNWVSTSTPTGITHDDETKSFNLPFKFKFYGKEYSRVYVCSNGFLSFLFPSTTYKPRNIPNSSSPNALVAGFWRDLHPERGGRITYYSGRDKFVVTYENVPNKINNNTQTFQIILYPNGEIVFQYRDITGDQTTVIGLENEDGSKGKSAATPSSGTAYRWIPSTKSIKSTTESETLHIKNLVLHRNHGIVLFTSSPTKDVKISIYNVLGQRVFDEWFTPSRRIEFSLPDLSKGMYIINIRTGLLHTRKKVLILE